MLYPLLLLSLLSACSEKSADSPAGEDSASGADSTSPDSTPQDFDQDGDGHLDEAAGGDDCDDLNGAVHPGADEYCDELDNDCDGVTDPDSSLDAPSWTVDADGDGYGDLYSASFTSCDGAEGLSSEGGDCQDGDPAIHPSAEELCDGIDNNCDEVADEGLGERRDWYLDADGDGHGDEDAEAGVQDCSQPEGYSDLHDDCDDTDPKKVLDCGNDPVSTTAYCSGGSIYFWAEKEPVDPELHVYGVYEGDGGHGAPATTTYVTVERDAEMTLVLSSYEPVHWEISVADGAELKEVILNGYNVHTASAPKSVTVTDRSGNPGYIVACGYQWPKGTGGCDTAGLIAGAEAMTGLTLTSFTGCYHGTDYTLQ